MFGIPEELAKEITAKMFAETSRSVSREMAKTVTIKEITYGGGNSKTIAVGESVEIFY